MPTHKYNRCNSIKITKFKQKNQLQQITLCRSVILSNNIHKKNTHPQNTKLKHTQTHTLKNPTHTQTHTLKNPTHTHTHILKPPHIHTPTY